MSILRFIVVPQALRGTQKSRIQRRPVTSHRGRSRRGGSVLVIVAGSVLMLMGFSAVAIDYGVLVMDANQLQRACDAAATAGAGELYKSGISSAAQLYDQSNARTLAVSIAQRNGVVISPNDVSFPASNKIKVSATRLRSLFFARALGVANGTVIRSATAGRIALRGVSQAVPLLFSKKT
jgi:uncharacterized membrane protein